ncbi:MAG: transporter substrate-binding domain-containing protein [Ruminococcus sp.]|nr:transporter substrate-binding domain-containing protein [Ruminococcus sp.]
MKIKKIISAAVSLCFSAAILSGCGGKTAENQVFSIADLEGKTIGVQLGTVGDTFASDIENASVERYNKGADAVQALKQGKVDAVLIDVEPAKVFVSNNSDLTILEETFAEEEYAIAIKKGNTELLEKINTALAQLKTDGTLDTIKSNWIGEEAGNHPYVTPEGTEYPNGKLVMATNAEFPPYELMSGEDVVGLDPDMMRAVCDILGMELEIENIEFDSIIAAVNSGKVDVGVAGMTVTPDRQENVDFSDSYTTATQVVIVRK